MPDCATTLTPKDVPLSSIVTPVSVFLLGVPPESRGLEKKPVVT